MIEITTKINDTHPGESMCRAVLPVEEQQRIARFVSDYVAARLKGAGQKASLITVQLDVSMSLVQVIAPADLFSTAEKKK